MSKIKMSISFGIATLVLMANVGVGFSLPSHSKLPLKLETPPPEQCENGTCSQNTSTGNSICGPGGCSNSAASSPCGPGGCGSGRGGGQGLGGGLGQGLGGGLGQGLGGGLGQGLGGGLGQGLGGGLGQGLGGIMQKLFSGFNPQMIMQMLTGLMGGKNQQQQQAYQNGLNGSDDVSSIIYARAAQTAIAQQTAAAQSIVAAQQTAIAQQTVAAQQTATARANQVP